MLISIFPEKDRNIHDDTFHYIITDTVLSLQVFRNSKTFYISVNGALERISDKTLQQ